MSPKNLNVTKIPKILKEKLSNKRIIKLYNNFEKDFDIKNAFITALKSKKIAFREIKVNKFDEDTLGKLFLSFINTFLIY